VDIVNLARNTETLQGGQIATAADMFTILDWGEENGYRGHINLDSSGNWSMSLTAPGGNTSQTGKIGDWVVLKNGTVATIVPSEQAPSLYSVAP
jgi:hypothetical protein